MRSNNELKFYFDLRLDKTVTIPNYDLTPNGKFTVGGGSWYWFTKTTIDGVRVYQRALSIKELRDAANKRN